MVIIQVDKPSNSDLPKSVTATAWWLDWKFQIQGGHSSPASFPWCCEQSCWRTKSQTVAFSPSLWSSCQGLQPRHAVCTALLEKSWITDFIPPYSQIPLPLEGEDTEASALQCDNHSGWVRVTRCGNTSSQWEPVFSVHCKIQAQSLNYTCALKH